MTQISIVSDLHVGLDGIDRDVSAIRQRVEAIGSDVLFVLGDVIHETGYWERDYENLDHVVEQLYGADIPVHVIGGNHDANAMSRTDFESLAGPQDTIVELDDGTTVGLVDTAFTNPLDNVAMLGQSSLSFIEENSLDIVMSHFPLTYTEHYRDTVWFNTYPEGVFPIDKSEFEHLDDKPTISVCGHLHMDSGLRWEHAGVWNRSVPPWTQFVEDSEEPRGVHHGQIWTVDTEFLLGWFGGER